MEAQLNEVRSLSNHYPRRDELMSHVSPVLHHYSSLRPEQGVYYHDDGRAERLLSLKGVIPVELRGTTYHCPLVLYLPLDYPSKPPIIRILPTPTMQVKPSAYIDAKTKLVSVPYMTDWGKKGEGCSLTPLMEILTTLFGTEYPLVSISTARQPPPAPPSTARSHSGPRPLPPSAAAAAARPPPRPPLPPGSTTGPQQQQQLQPPTRGGTPAAHERNDSFGSDGARQPPPPPRPPPPPAQQFGSPNGYHHSPPPPGYQGPPPPPQPPQPPRQSSWGGPPPRPPPPPASPLPPIQHPSLIHGPPIPTPASQPPRPGTTEPYNPPPPPRPPPPPHGQSHPIYLPTQGGPPPPRSAVLPGPLGFSPAQHNGPPPPPPFAQPPPPPPPPPPPHPPLPLNGAPTGYQYPPGAGPNGAVHAPYGPPPPAPHAPAPPGSYVDPIAQVSGPPRTSSPQGPPNNFSPQQPYSPRLDHQQRPQSPLRQTAQGPPSTHSSRRHSQLRDPRAEPEAPPRSSREPVQSRQSSYAESAYTESAYEGGSTYAPSSYAESTAYGDDDDEEEEEEEDSSSPISPGSPQGPPPPRRNSHQQSQSRQYREPPPPQPPRRQSPEPRRPNRSYSPPPAREPAPARRTKYASTTTSSQGSYRRPTSPNDLYRRPPSPQEPHRRAPSPQESYRRSSPPSQDRYRRQPSPPLSVMPSPPPGGRGARSSYAPRIPNTPVPPPFAHATRPSRLSVNILDGPEDMLSGDTPSPVAYRGGSSSAAPPRPPNPELLAIRTRLHSKLNTALSSLEARTDTEMERMAVLEADLLKGEPAILDEMQRLDVVRGVCDNVRDRYQSLVNEGEKRLADYEMRGEGPEVDEIVCSSTVVYNQLLELVAEDAALEDTIYHLGRGLNSEEADIDLERFLKRVRGLARQQFIARALTNKILLALAVRREQQQQRG